MTANYYCIFEIVNHRHKTRQCNRCISLKKNDELAYKCTFNQEANMHVHCIVSATNVLFGIHGQ